MVEPLWITVPKAMKWFNWQESLPKVALKSLGIISGISKVGNSDKPAIITSSISEDYARVWLFFAQKHLGNKDWDFIIIDSSGSMEPSRLPGSNILQFVNLYHGQKVDVVLRKVIQSENIFLCDDDKYVVQDVSEELNLLNLQDVAVVSLSPRRWWKFKINNQEYLPMGSYALLFKKSFFLTNQLRFQSPKGVQSKFKVFPPDVKHQMGYDTADYANEKLLNLGYKVVTLSDSTKTIGFDGLSCPRILVNKFGKTYVKEALKEAKHYKEGSTNGYIIKGIYGLVKFEQLYQKLFGEKPRFSSNFLESEIMFLVENNPIISWPSKEKVFSYFEELEARYRRLNEYV